MAWYPYSYKTAFDPTTGDRAPAGSAGEIYAIGDTGFTTPLQPYDLAGLPVELAVQGDLGYIPTFQVEDETSVVWKSGDYIFEFITTMPLPGPTGAKIVDGVNNGDGTVTFTLSDGTTTGPIAIPEGPRGPAGYNATGAAEDQQTIADYINETAGVNPVSSSLDAKYVGTGSLTLNIKDYGATGDGAPADTTAIQDALTAAATWGASVFVPPGNYVIDTGLVVPAGVTVYGVGDSSIITQTVWPEPLFDAQNNADVTIRDLRGVNAAERVQTGYMYSERGTLAKAGSAFVRSHADRTSVINCSETGFESGVNFCPWDVATDTEPDTWQKGCVVDGFHVEDTWSGVLVKKFDGLTINNITGSYAMSADGTQEPHLLYVGSLDADTEPCYGLRASNCYAYDGDVIGAAFQFKGIVGGIISNLTARNCPGILSFMGLKDTSFDGITSIADTYSGEGGAVSQVSTDAMERVSISNVKISLVNDAHAFRLFNGVDCKLSGAVVNVAHTTAGPNTDDFDIMVYGGWEVDRPIVRNTGPLGWNAIGIWSGTSIIRDPQTSGSRCGVKVRASAESSMVELSPERIGLHAANSVAKVDNISTTSRIITNENQHLHTPSYLSISTFLVGFGTTSALMGSDYGPQWEQLSGVWVVDSTGGYAQNTQASQGTAAVDVGTPNVEVDLDVAWEHNTGIALHAIDGDNRIWVRLANTGAEILKEEAGSGTNLATAPFAAQGGRRYRFRATSYNGFIEFFVDGVKLLEYTLTTAEQDVFGVATKHGLASHTDATTRFHQFSVKALS